MIGLGLGQPVRPLAPTASVEEPRPHAASTGSVAPELVLRLRDLLGSRFEVEELVAAGGMATLYRVRHRAHGGLLVAKVLREDLAKRPEVADAFRREARHAACVGDHPNAIPVFDFLERDDLLALVMPFVEGEDLDHVLQHRGPFPREEALHFAAQISSLLCHAESHGITHCDIAPGNIRLDVFGRYRLMDFGVSFSTEAKLGVSLGGTPLYNSPEQLEGQAPDVRSDLYALGAVLVEVLTGEQIFRAATLEAIRARHLAEERTLPASLAVDPVLAPLLKRLLARNKAKRLQSAFELSEALALLGFERPEFRPRVVQHRAEAKAKRSRLSS